MTLQLRRNPYKASHSCIKPFSKVIQYGNDELIQYGNDENKVTSELNILIIWKKSDPLG